MNWIKQNWFNVLMWGFFFLIVFSIYYSIVSDYQICGYDTIYDNNCGELNN